MKRCLFLLIVIVLSVPLPAKTITIDRLDTNHSTIQFRVPIMGGMSEVTGKFTDFSVSISYDDVDLTKSHVTASIRTASVDTGIADRDKHLRTPDFFDCEKFPEIRFESSRIEKTSDGYQAVGTLTMRGVSRPILLPFRLTGTHRLDEKKSTGYGFSASAALNRQDYGVKWKHPVEPAFVGDDVTIEIRLVSKQIPDPPADPSAPAK